MDSSEKNELFLLGFIWLNDKRKRKKLRIWVRKIFRHHGRQGVFLNLLLEFQLGDREYYFK